MRRDIPIRITKNDRQEYERLVRNTKAKVRRTAKNYGIDLSREVELPDISEFKTREQFNEWKNKQKSFTSVSNQNYQFKKNEFGVVASKKELSEIERNTKRAQEIAKKLIKEVENKPWISGGKEQGTIGQRMKQMAKPNVAGIYVPPDFDFEKIRSRSQLEKKKENMEKRSGLPKYIGGHGNYFDERMTKMRNNFIDLLDKTFNSDAEQLIDKMRFISSDDFYEMYLMFDEFDFDYVYTMDENEGAEFVSKLESYVDRYFDGKINMDLKGF